MFVFLLDELLWAQVKFSNSNNRFDKVCNHCMTVVTNNDDYERVLIFGGVGNRLNNKGFVHSALSNQLYTLEIKFKA